MKAETIAVLLVVRTVSFFGKFVSKVLLLNFVVRLLYVLDAGIRPV